MSGPDESLPSAEAGNVSALSDQEDVQSEREFTLFAAFWAFAMLFHLASYDLFFQHPKYFIHTVLALGVLFWARSTWLFLALSAYHVVYVIDKAPSYSNHEFFAVLAEITILLSVVRRMIADRRFGISRARLYRDFAPLLRWELIVLYFFAVVHKVNIGYLDPAESCAVFHYENLRVNVFPFLPGDTFTHELVIYGSLVIETAIPLFLVFPRFRTSGLVLGVLFHGVLGLSHISKFFNFSAMLYAFFFLCCGPPFTVAVARISKKLNDARIGEPPFQEKILVRGFLTLILMAFLINASRFLWIMYMVGFSALYFFGLWSTRRTKIARQVPSARMMLAPTSLAMLAMPVAVFLNAMSPYLGLKTESSLAMYSNLRTEGVTSNSLIFPDWLRVADWQDFIVIKASSDPMLAEAAKQKQPFTYFDFRSYLSKRPKTAVVFERNGVEHTLERASKDPELVQPYSPFLTKFVRFRVLPRLGTPNGCSH